MYEALRKVLGNEQIDFAMSGRSSALIELWSRMYEEKSPWLHEIDNANIPATVAGEIARLTTLELQSKVDGSPRADFLNSMYQNVLGKLRVQTEYAFAKGSMVFKPYVSVNGIAIQYIQADMFFPLDFDSEKMTRCAFLDQFRKGNAIYSRIELYSLDGDTLSIKNRVFVARTKGTLGSEISIGSVPRWSELAEEMQFSGVSKLPIGYFAVPLGNNKDSGRAFLFIHGQLNRLRMQIGGIHRLTGSMTARKRRYISLRACLNTIQIQTAMSIRAARNVCTGASNMPLARRTSRFWMSFPRLSVIRHITTDGISRCA